MAVATLPAHLRRDPDQLADAAAGVVAAPLGPESREPGVPLVEVLTLGHELAVSINNQLVLPVGVLELLVAHAAVPADLRPMLVAARDALRRTASEAEQLQAVTHRPA
jgi:hypothetical protein